MKNNLAEQLELIPVTEEEMHLARVWKMKSWFKNKDKEDQMEVVEVAEKFDEAKEAQFADITISIQHGKVMKVWITKKSKFQTGRIDD